MTHEEVIDILEFEDKAGVCSTAQDAFYLMNSGVPKESIAYLGEFDSNGELGEVTVIDTRTWYLEE